jgi:hypothetical protein
MLLLRENSSEAINSDSSKDEHAAYKDDGDDEGDSEDEDQEDENEDEDEDAEQATVDEREISGVDVKIMSDLELGSDEDDAETAEFDQVIQEAVPFDFDEDESSDMSWKVFYQSHICTKFHDNAIQEGK